MRKILINIRDALSKAIGAVGDYAKRGTRKALDVLQTAIHYVSNNIINLKTNSIKSTGKTAVQWIDDNESISNKLIDLAFSSNAITTSTASISEGKVFTTTYSIYVDKDANIKFPLGDEETSEAIIQLKQMADGKLPKTITSPESGYDVVLSATFTDPERNDYAWSSAFENKDITLGHIHDVLAKKQIEYTMYLSAVRVMYSVRPAKKGGCSDRAKIHTFSLNNRRRVKAESVKSKQHNCGPLCFMKKLGINGNKVRPDNVRKELGIPLGVMIAVEDLYKLSDYFKCGHVVYDGDDGYRVIGEHALDRDVIVELILAGEHYMFVKSEPEPIKTCDMCWKKYRNTHTCSINRISYVREQIDPAGKKWVRNTGYKKTKKICYNRIVPFDIETFPLGENRKHTPYNVDWYVDGVWKNAYGEGCMNVFIADVAKMKDKILVAYNGARYDNYMLMNALMKNGLEIKNHIISCGRILSISFGSCKVMDLCQFTTATLEKACKDFGTKHTKYHFDHDKMRSWEDVETHKQEVLKYGRNDVECLRDLFIKFNDIVHEISGVNISNYVTLSHMAYDLWSMDVEDKTIQIFEDMDMYCFVKSAMYGGRCYPLVRETKSEFYDEVVSAVDLPKEERVALYGKILKSGKYLFNADVTSLYPSAMAGTDYMTPEYPVGEARWSDDPENDFKTGVLGFYDVEWECPNKKLLVPVLPVRSKGGLVQSIGGGRAVYSNVDIQNALSCGYTFKFVGKGLVWDNSSSNIFVKYVKRWFDIKKTNTGKTGNKSLRAIAKLMINSLYGKQLQGIISDGSKFCYDISDVWEFRREYKIKEWDVFESDKGRCLRLSGLLHDNLENKMIRKPIQNGAFILAYSRRIMIHLMRAVDPSLESVVFTYHDCDCVHITGQAHKKLNDLGYIRDSELGYLCSDIDNDALVVNEVCHASKTYCDEYIDSEGNIYVGDSCKMIAKGIPEEDKIGPHGKLLQVSMYKNGVPILKEFQSFKKIKKGEFCVQTIDSKRTFLKTQYGRMTLYNNRYYPFGYDQETMISNSPIIVF